MKTVEMPKMGDTMEEGKILRWIKQEGDQVKKGESLAEVETDKVNIEIESFASGVLRKILVPEGKSAPIGAGIALIGAADEALPAELAGNGATGKKSETRVKEGNGIGYATQTVAQQASVQVAPAEPGQERIFISPIARRVAEEHQLDYQQIQGTGPNGRIIKMDVEAALAQRQAVAAAPAVPAVPSPVEIPVPGPAPVAVEVGEAVEIPLTAMRRTIARRLGQSWLASPHFYVTSVIDTGKLADLRRQINGSRSASTT